MHATQSSTIGVTAPALDVGALACRLAELSDLHARGLLTELEHHAARAAAFDEV